ncbi:unnamed protein product [Staurois parvus]|uniref:Uncharacterized protein n=1 Tax=Staurois parvus TaxID=386267 RepID=A0ABN9CRS6_9NEOB|nr:unnamed protein product [Staurois parvus]
MFLELMASKLSGVAKVRSTKKKKKKSCMVPNVKHGGGSVLLWGLHECCWCQGPTFH